MGRSQRQKGARGELEARSVLASLSGVATWRRSANQSGRFGGAGQPDLVSPDRPGLHPEVKVGKAPPLFPALDQARQDARNGDIPFVVARRDQLRPGSPATWVLVVAVEDLPELIRRLGGPGAVAVAA